MVITLLILLLTLITTVWFHAAGLGLLRRLISRQRIKSHLSLAAIASSVMLLHLFEITIYAVAIWLLNAVVNVGDIVGDREFGVLDYFYYSAETFTSLGQGDLRSTDALRLVTAVEPLNGLLLLAWSGAFTYWVMEHFWNTNNSEQWWL